MRSQQFRLINDNVRRNACEAIMRAPEGYVCKIAAETRNDRQNALMWALIADLQAQVPELAPYSADDIKLRFLHALGVEMRFLPALEGAGTFPTGMRSSQLTVAQFSGLTELLYAYGAKNNVRWSKEIA